MMRRIREAAIAMLCTTPARPAVAQRTVTMPGETVTAAATIEKLDPAKRFVVLRDDDGSEVGVFARRSSRGSTSSERATG